MGNFNNYHEFWISRFGDKFFDMGTFTRLASELEKGLKYYYMEKKGYRNLIDLKQDKSYKKGIFQKLMPAINKNDFNLIELFKKELSYNLEDNSQL